MIILFLVGFAFGYAFINVVMNNGVYKIGKILFAIIFFVAIATNIHMYIIAKDSELIVSMHPISMSVGIFLGLVSFVFSDTKKYMY